jgi:phenylpropionate dioxygenase-like ring-hydroxylating dioxygenase large terminal subunit
METAASQATHAQVRDLLAERRKGFSLPGPFYTSPAVFEVEYDSFLASQWMQVGHVSQIPRSGDFFRFEVAGNALIIVRGNDGEVRALHNVCRHRGARVCEATRGTAKRFHCRYHAWSYNLDGSLLRSRHMAEDFDAADYGLKPCATRLFNGMIFVSLDAERAPDFDAIAAVVAPYWQRYDLTNCEIAAEETYVLDANWKLGIENNLECYHCLSSHPEYTSVNAFVKVDEKISDGAAFTQYVEDFRLRLTAAGIPTGRSGLHEIDRQICRAGTSPLSRGFATGSRDGQPLAPLLGEIDAYDESITTGCIGFLSYMVAMNDYAWTVTYVPQSATLTHVVARWYVRAGAVEGVDYDRQKLLWLWDETTKQDKDIIELNASGVTSRGYRPGPYSQLEAESADFVDRYCAMMAQAVQE